MAIRINTEDNEIIVSDVATEDTLLELLKAVEGLKKKGNNTTDASKQAKNTGEKLEKLAKSVDKQTITLTDWAGNMDDASADLSADMAARSKAVAGALGKVVKNTGNVISDLIRGPASFESLGRAIQQGAGFLGDGLGAAADSISVLGTKLPGVGAGLSMVGAAAGAAAMAIAAYAQNMYDGFIALSQSGANYNGDIVRTAGQVQGLGITMNAFTQIVQQNAAGLANFGGTVSAGAKRFVELADVMHGKFGGELYALGITFDEQAEQMAKFTQTQSRNTNFQNLSYAQQSVLFKDYITDLTKLTGLTGKSRQQLSEELAQNDLRADANLRLGGATVEARKALEMAFSASGGQDSAISQLLMAGIAGKDLAQEMAAGNTTIKNFVAGNSEAAKKIRDLGDAVATGKITQDEFHKQMAAITPAIERSGKEFQSLYGINDVATTMTEAGSSVQKYNVQIEQLRKAEADGIDTTTKSAEGAGGAIMDLSAQLVSATSSIKSGVNTGIADFVESMGFSDAKDLGAKIQGSIDKFGTMADLIIDAFSDFYTQFSIVAAAPWDYLLGGTSTKELRSQASGHIERLGLGDTITPDFISSLSGEDATALIKGSLQGKDQALATYEAIKTRKGEEIAVEKEEIVKASTLGNVETDSNTLTTEQIEADLNLKKTGNVDANGTSATTGNVATSGSEVTLEADLNLKKTGNVDANGTSATTGNVATSGSEVTSSTPSFNADSYSDLFSQKPLENGVILPNGNIQMEAYGHDSPIASMLTQWSNATNGLGTGSAYQYAAHQFANNVSDLMGDNDGIMPDSMSATIAEMQKIFNTNDIGLAADGFEGMLGKSGKLQDLWHIRSMINNRISSNGLTPPFKQYGGAVGMGNPYIVGERGSELFTPSAGGTITPNEELSTAQHSENIYKALKESNKINEGIENKISKNAELYASLTSEQIDKLNTLIKLTTTGNKIANTISANS